MYLEASISEMMETCALQSDEVSAVAGEADERLVSELDTGGDAEISERGTVLCQLHHSFITHIPAAVDIDQLQSATPPHQLIQRLIPNV